MFVCLRMQCPSVQCGCGNRNGLWCVPQHLVLEDWEVPQWDNSWEPRSSWIPFAKLTMEIHGRFSLPKMIHDDLYVEKNMRIYILCILYIYTRTQLFSGALILDHVRTLRQQPLDLSNSKINLRDVTSTLAVHHRTCLSQFFPAFGSFLLLIKFPRLDPMGCGIRIVGRS